MPITHEIVAIGPKGDMQCYILPNGIQSSQDVDEVIDRYIGEATLNHYPGEGMTREELREKGWVTIFCAEEGHFWVSDAMEC